MRADSYLNKVTGGNIAPSVARKWQRPDVFVAACSALFPWLARAKFSGVFDEITLCALSATHQTADYPIVKTKKWSEGSHVQ